MPRDSYIRETFTMAKGHARERAKEYFRQYPKKQYLTEVESWEMIQAPNFRFTMKRLREPIGESS